MKINEIILRAVCPYCGYENTIRYASSDFNDRDIILCDCESGGCDKYFAVFNRIIGICKTAPIDIDKSFMVESVKEMKY